MSFVLGLSINNIASSEIPPGFKVAIVDVQAVVKNSSQVNNLKKEQQNKLTELKNFVESANAAIAKETNADKKKQLEEKYAQELISKKTALDKEYSKKLNDIDKSISETITAKAKSSNYDLVLAKNVVLAGGTDITSEITKMLK